MVDGAKIRARKGYHIKRVYLVNCDKCNEDITRTWSGEDVEFLSAARDLIREHDSIVHPKE